MACVGMEVAGGVLVSQLASAAHSPLHEWMDFVYMRKERKTTGTGQLLEGPQRLTSRSSSSPPIRAIWVDDALSTGSSLRDGTAILAADYNIHVVAALYLVDRTKDRQNLRAEMLALADPSLQHVDVRAIFALDDVDALIPKP